MSDYAIVDGVRYLIIKEEPTTLYIALENNTTEVSALVYKNREWRVFADDTPHKISFELNTSRRATVMDLMNVPHPKALMLCSMNPHLKIYCDRWNWILCFKRSQFDCNKYTHEEAIDIDAELNSSDDQSIIREVGKNHLEVVKYLIEVLGMDPAAYDNEAIILASSLGYLELVKFLIDVSDRVDSTAQDDRALIEASTFGHLNTVKYLSFQLGVNLAAQDNSAIIGASKYGHLDIVKYLINLPGVNPAAQGNRAIRLTTNMEVAEFLNDDPRVIAQL